MRLDSPLRLPDAYIFLIYVIRATCITHHIVLDFIILIILDREPGSSVSIVSAYRLDDRAIGVDPRLGQRIFPLTSVSRPALRPTQPPVQWVPGVPSPGVKARPGRDTDHSAPSSAEVKNKYELYLLSSQEAPWRVAGLLLLLVILDKCPHSPVTLFFVRDNCFYKSSNSS
jgi:hypothetical protein